MSRFHRPRVATSSLASLAVAALALLLLFEALAPEIPHPEFGIEERAAIQRTLAAQRALADARRSAISAETAAELRRTDPHDTGLIGVEWSPLVTTPGTLEAKQASCDPRWAALFCRWMERAGVGPDASVAIGSSASFPAPMLAARIAAESLGARPIIVASLAASNYGATIPEFDLFAMEQVLLAQGHVTHPIDVLTPGGDEDRLAGLEQGDREQVLVRLEAIRRLPNAPTVVIPADRAEAIALRDDVLFGQSHAKPALFINIGGHAANYGVGASALAMPRGAIDPAAISGIDAIQGDSMIVRALRSGIPVVNVLDVRGILFDEGLVPSPGGDAAAILLSRSPTVRVLSMILAFTLAAALLWMRRVQLTRRDANQLREILQ